MIDNLETQLVNQLKALKEIRLLREPVFDDIIKYIIPALERYLILRRPQKGSRIGTSRYDGTGVSALQLFADGLFGYLISPNIAWLKLTMDEPLMQYQEVREWLQAVEEHYYHIYSQTNFYDAMSTYFEHAPAFGYAVKYSEEDIKTGKIIYNIYHPGTCYLSENKYGYVDTLFREEYIEVGKAIDKFGNNTSKKLREIAEKNPFKTCLFLHAVYPNNNRDLSKIDSINKPFTSIWAQQDMIDPGKSKLQIVKKSGYDMNPYHVWRYKQGVTAYGTGPGENALIEAMGLNEIQKSLLLAAQKSVEPPMNVPGEMQGKVDLAPNGMNYYSNPEKVIRPVDRGVDFPVGIDREERLQAAIHKHFKVEFFTLLSQMEGRAKTATEVIELMGEKAAVLGRPINRLNNECLNQEIDRTFAIEYKAGRLPPMPPILEDRMGERIDVEYIGPLAQAQKKLFQMQGYSQGLEQIAPILELHPEAGDVINWDETTKGILRVTGFPQKSINDDTEIQKIRQARVNVEQQEQVREEMGAGSEMVEKLARADQATGGKISDQMEGVMNAL